MIELDQTHDPKLASWVASANGHADFPIQNLPLGLFSPGGATPRTGIAIGDAILDLRAVLDGGLLSGEPIAPEERLPVPGEGLAGFLAGAQIVKRQFDRVDAHRAYSGCTLAARTTRPQRSLSSRM